MVRNSKKIQKNEKIDYFPGILSYFNQSEILQIWDNPEYKEKHPDVPLYKKSLQLFDSMLIAAPKPELILGDIPYDYETCRENNETNNGTDCEKMLQDLPINILRYIPAAVVQINHYLKEYLIEISGNDTNVLQVLGFAKSSGAYQFYSKFGDYLLLILENYRSEEMQDLVSTL